MAQPQTAIPTAMPKSEFPRASPVPMNTTAGTKRKRVPSEQKFYAVAKGKKPGVYYTWEECLDQVRGQKGALCMASLAGRLLATQANGPSQSSHFPRYMRPRHSPMASLWSHRRSREQQANRNTMQYKMAESLASTQTGPQLNNKSPAFEIQGTKSLTQNKKQKPL